MPFDHRYTGIYSGRGGAKRIQRQPPRRPAWKLDAHYGVPVVVETAKSWAKDNSGLLLFLAAQFIAMGAAGASTLAYFTKLETRVSIMETRGAEYTVDRMNRIDQRITVLEQKIDKNANSVERIIDIMTKKLNINPQ
jgi:hypothetical protein